MGGSLLQAQSIFDHAKDAAKSVGKNVKVFFKLHCVLILLFS